MLVSMDLNKFPFFKTITILLLSFVLGHAQPDANLGRLLNLDPEITEGPNLYVMVDNDPLNYVDPDGRAKYAVGKNAYLAYQNRIRKSPSLRGKFQVHHIIGKNVFDNPKVGAFLKELGFDQDTASNLLALPNKKGKAELAACGSKHASRTLHVGRHSADAYVDKVVDEIDRIQGLYKNGTIDACEARGLVAQLQNLTRDKLKKGEIELNSAKIWDSLQDGAVSIGGLAIIDLASLSVSSRIQTGINQGDLAVVIRVTTYTEGGNACIALAGQVAEFFNPLTDLVEIPQNGDTIIETMQDKLTNDDSIFKISPY
jgi:hypothetical protein